MAEVIGDDLQAFIAKAKQQGSVPQDFDVPYAHTPAFDGSHVDGYDNMLEGILKHYWINATPVRDDSINIIPGFDGFCVGNIRELKRMLDLMGVDRVVSRSVRRVRHADERHVRHVCRRHDHRGGQGGDQRQGDDRLQEYCSKRSLAHVQGQGARRPRRSIIRSASPQPTSS